MSRKRSALQIWSANRNYFKRTLVISKAKLHAYLHVAEHKSHVKLDGTKVPFLSETETAKLNEAYRLMQEVSDNYREEYFKIRAKVL